MLRIFHVPAHHPFLWRKCLFRFSAHFLIEVFFFVVVVFVVELYGCLYILKIKPLSVALFATIFSHSIDCLFLKIWFPLLCKTCLIRSHWFIFILFFRASPVAYGGYQARGQIEAVPAGLYHRSQQRQILNSQIKARD